MTTPARIAVLEGIAMPVYSARQVAEIVGKASRSGKPWHVQTLKYHIYDSGYLAGFGTVIGHALAFTDDEIEKMKAIVTTMPLPGRKAAVDVEQPKKKPAPKKRKRAK